MSDQVLLNLLNKLRKKRVKMRGLSGILSLFATSLINSIIQEHECKIYLSYDIKIILKSHFCRKNVILMCATLLWTS